MDDREHELDAVRDDLLAWGLLELGPRGLTWTRRFRGALMRQASQLASDESRGQRPHGSPLVVAVDAALRELRPDAGRAHAQLLAAVELAALPASVRSLLA